MRKNRLANDVALQMKGILFHDLIKTHFDNEELIQGVEIGNWESVLLSKPPKA